MSQEKTNDKWITDMSTEEFTKHIFRWGMQSFPLGPELFKVEMAKATRQLKVREKESTLRECALRGTLRDISIRANTLDLSGEIKYRANNALSNPSPAVKEMEERLQRISQLEAENEKLRKQLEEKEKENKMLREDCIHYNPDVYDKLRNELTTLESLLEKAEKALKYIADNTDCEEDNWAGVTADEVLAAIKEVRGK